MTDTTYKRRNEPIFEKVMVGPEGYTPWGITPNGLRPEGTVVMRSIGNMPQIVFIGSAEDAAEEFEEV